MLKNVMNNISQNSRLLFDNLTDYRIALASLYFSTAVPRIKIRNKRAENYGGKRQMQNKLMQKLNRAAHVHSTLKNTKRRLTKS